MEIYISFFPEPHSLLSYVPYIGLGKGKGKPGKRKLFFMSFC
jgi:hypothetical protein